MANYDITMKQYNGSNYDELYPKSIDSQIVVSTDSLLSKLAFNSEKILGVALSRINKLTLIQSYKTAGNYTWTCPSNGNYFVVIIGGGGGGDAQFGATGTKTWSSGPSGFVNYSYISATQNSNYNLVVGAGGSGGSGTHTLYPNSTSGVTRENGTAGGTSSFAGVTANGGKSYGGNWTNAYGGQWPGMETPQLFGGEPTYESISYIGSQSYPWFYFVDITGRPVSMLYAGGQAISLFETEFQPTLTLLNGNTTSGGVYGIPTSATESHSCNTPTDPGAGGGSIYYLSPSDGIQCNMTLKAGDGAPGGVFIFSTSE